MEVIIMNFRRNSRIVIIGLWIFCTCDFFKLRYGLIQSGSRLIHRCGVCFLRHRTDITNKGLSQT
ncbi:hypothetical protein D3C87_1599900 [compost metagenome]